MSDARPDPDRLLRRIEAAEVREGRARLRIFFGFAPGVGKTYRMLEIARRQREAGVDVVVGAVETHGRAETAALLAGLPVVPRKRLEHRGRALDEVDLDALLARRPAVVLLDELAHANVPGARFAKRWQDACALLDAGIEVWTTLNVQHVESLNDVVAQITGVRVRETVPDAILERADELELVDVAPDELLQRLQSGKVYVPEQAERALRSFFRRGNLLALRELALRRTAERVDADVRAYREQNEIERVWPAGERVLVCVGPAPASADLVRAARRMAAGLRCPWVAATVTVTTSAPPSEEARARVDAHLRLAESLGGAVVRLEGTKVSDALLAYARRANVTRIVLGKPTHPRLRDRLRGSLLDEVVRGSGDVDVHVTSGDPAEVAERSPPAASGGPRWLGLAVAVALVALVTGLGGLLRGWLGVADHAMLYLLAIMVVAGTSGRAPALLASALSVAALDFFFIPPFFTLAVSDARHVLTFAVLFLVGVVVSSLGERVRREEHAARGREARTAALYASSRELASVLGVDEVADVVARHAVELVGAGRWRGAGVALVEDRGALRLAARVAELPWGPQEEAVARWVVEHGRPAGRGTDTLPGARIVCFPIGAAPDVRGVLALGAEDADGTTPALDLETRDLAAAIAGQAALAVARERLAAEARAAALRARSEEMRSSLLSAVSHDLRTPLAVITGAATTLREEPPQVSPEQRRDLVDTLCEEAERLERLVANLLDMTRLESGGLRVARDWVPAEELVGSALGRLEGRLVGRPITVDLPADLPLLSVDPVSFEQVLVNLLENAAKYTPAAAPIRVSAASAGEAVELVVEDRGPGLPAGDEARVFEKFWRGAHVGVPGVGLGLAICKGIVEAHGGSIHAENREGGGARFVVRVPRGAPPPVPEAPP